MEAGRPATESGGSSDAADGMDSAKGAEGVDAGVALVLEHLWAARRESPGRPWSLAKLAKRAALPMSVLRRTLTLLQAAGLADFELDEAGRGFAALSAEGEALCATVAPPAEGREAVAGGHS